VRRQVERLLQAHPDLLGVNRNYRGSIRHRGCSPQWA
jgi:hypothetical protein